MIRYHPLVKGFKEELQKHEMNILDDPILREPSGRKVRQAHETINRRESAIIDKKDATLSHHMASPEQTLGLEDEVDLNDASNLVPTAGMRRNPEESSVFLNQSLVSANNVSAMDSSLILNTSVLAMKCKSMLTSKTAGAHQLQSARQKGRHSDFDQGD